MIRTGFVANSSSSSFVVNKKDITPLQVILILHYPDVAEWLDLSYSDYSWYVYETPLSIAGNTPMDNFDMREFFVAIGIDVEKAQFEVR